jgi:hypothetical protein
MEDQVSLSSRSEEIHLSSHFLDVKSASTSKSPIQIQNFGISVRVSDWERIKFDQVQSPDDP